MLPYLTAAAASAKSLQSCPTLCDPIDGLPPGSPIPGFLQARVLEWGAIAFSVVEAYSATKTNTVESVLMRWMVLKFIIQSEVSQKEKDKYHILMHIYGIYKDGTDNLTYRAAKET